MEQVIGHNGVVHAHATFVKNAHDSFLLAESTCKRTADIFVCRGDFHEVKGCDMPKVVLNGSFLQPFAKAAVEKIVPEIHAPQGTEGDTCLCKRAIEVEHAYQTRPLTTPVGYGKDRSLVRG